jgi:hypothetical protein
MMQPKLEAWKTDNRTVADPWLAPARKWKAERKTAPLPDMTTQQVRSFAEVSFLEAVARRARVDLVLNHVPQGVQSRLISRFLRLQGADRLILDIPVDEGRKVYIPAGWSVGMAFSVGQYFLQATTTVIGTCPCPLYKTRRVDALLVDRPTRIIAADRRRNPRHQIDPHVYVFVSLWPASCLVAGDPAVTRIGRVLNYSQDGLGVRLEAPLDCGIGTEMILRLEQGRADEYPIYRAILRHHTQDPDGLWLAGFGEVAELTPGGASSLIEAIAAAGG